MPPVLVPVPVPEPAPVPVSVPAVAARRPLAELLARGRRDGLLFTCFHGHVSTVTSHTHTHTHTHTHNSLHKNKNKHTPCTTHPRHTCPSRLRRRFVGEGSTAAFSVPAITNNTATPRHHPPPQQCMVSAQHTTQEREKKKGKTNETKRNETKRRNALWANPTPRSTRFDEASHKGDGVAHAASRTPTYACGVGVRDAGAGGSVGAARSQWRLGRA